MTATIFFILGILYVSAGILLVLHMIDNTDWYLEISNWFAFVMVYFWPLTLLIGWSRYFWHKHRNRVIW